MGKTKIYASEISNLTDARYFAAWYVQWLGLDLKKCLNGEMIAAQFKAFMEWLDVAHFVGEFTGLEKVEEIVGLLSDLEMEAVKVGPFCPKSTLKELSANVVFKEIVFTNESQLDQIRKNMESEEGWVDHYIIKAESSCQTHYLEEYFDGIRFYFDLPNPLAFIEKGILHSPICEGLLLKGGSEEKVGVKSFEDYDDIYDILMED